MHEFKFTKKTERWDSMLDDMLHLQRKFKTSACNKEVIIMLQAQVNYWSLLENARHNLVTEGISSDTLIESIRHNRETERQGQVGLTQNQQSIQYAGTNAKANFMNAMTNAANAATQRFRAETDAALGYGNLGVAELNASSNAKNAETNAANVKETARYNTLQENRLEMDRIKNGADIAFKAVDSMISLLKVYKPR